MKLIRFLSLGKSLKASKDHPGAYKMESASAIPRFDPAQRVLALETAPAAAAAGAAASEAGVPPLARARKGGDNAWSAMMRNLVGDDSSRRRTVHHQIELDLDHVKVVRNDLSEADIAVVTRGSMAARRVPDSAFNGRQASLWMRLTERVFNAHKDPFASPSTVNSGYSAKQTRELIART